MPRLAVSEGQDPLIDVWAGQAPALTVPAAQLSAAVYEHSTLPIREFESARITIARINDCQMCLGWRSARDVDGRADEAGDIDEAFYDAVRERRFDGLTEREVMAAEFADRFATDHLSMDDAFWDRLRAAFTDAEIVELSMCLGSWIAFGRLNHVLGLDAACVLPSHLSKH